MECYFPGILVYELIILQPFVNRLLCLVHFSVVDGWPLNDICLGEHFTDSRDSPAEAIAAMSGEKDDGLAAEIISVEKGIDGHRHVVPPQGIANEDDIIVGEVVHPRFQFCVG